MFVTSDQVRPTLLDLPETLPAACPPEMLRPTLEQVVEAVRQDCLVQSRRYLEEVDVPFGGE
jgi:hypothetical protein